MPAVVGTDPCGCVKFVADPSLLKTADVKADIRYVRRRHGNIRMNVPTAEVRAMEWLCPEHKSLERRLAASKEGK